MALKDSQLAALIKYRSTLEKQAKAAYALAVDEEEAVKQNLINAEHERKAAIGVLETKQKEGIKIHELLTLENGISAIEEKISRCRKEVVAAKQKTTTAQKQLEHAMKERKVMDKLKEKHDIALAAEKKLKETKQLDEISIQKHRDTR